MVMRSGTEETMVNALVDVQRSQRQVRHDMRNDSE